MQTTKKQRIITSLGLAVLAGVSLVTPALAVVNIGYVPVGNPGNVADSTGFGAVPYAYQIAKNETTISQYAAFLNAVAAIDTHGLYSPNMSGTGNYPYVAGINRSGSSGSYFYSVVDGSANKPVTFVSWFDAARFCNWVHNGQPTGPQNEGSTEDGAYTLNGPSGVNIFKNAAAKVWIPSENEWYKAAYFDPTMGGTGGYWKYPTHSNALGGNSVGVANSANYYAGGWVGYPGMALTDVGAYGANSDSFYGTNDQGGNVWEWTDAVMYGSSRVLRGGAWGGFVALASSDGGANVPNSSDAYTGFRVASVPEPSCVVLTLLASGALVTRRRR